MFKLKVLTFLMVILLAHFFLTLFREVGVSESKTVFVKKGCTLREVVFHLYDEFIIRNPVSFLLLLKVVGHKPKVPFGAYDIYPDDSPFEVLTRIENREVARRKILVEPGVSKYKIVDKINKDPNFTGFLSLEYVESIQEGVFFPDTYHFEYGMDRKDFIRLLLNEMFVFLNDSWKRRCDGCILKSPAEVLILASIVEKEVPSDGDMHKVAAVFMNRLKIGMRLQSDVTSSYFLNLGRGKFRAPTSYELKIRNDYNTYLNFGLPPTPIANPSPGAIEAVVCPSLIDSLYFFSDRNGVTHFSKSFKAHKKGIRELLK